MGFRALDFLGLKLLHVAFGGIFGLQGFSICRVLGFAVLGLRFCVASKIFVRSSLGEFKGAAMGFLWFWGKGYEGCRRCRVEGLHL